MTFNVLVLICFLSPRLFCLICICLGGEVAVLVMESYMHGFLKHITLEDQYSLYWLLLYYIPLIIGIFYHSVFLLSLSLLYFCRTLSVMLANTDSDKNLQCSLISHEPVKPTCVYLKFCHLFGFSLRQMCPYFCSWNLIHWAAHTKHL